MSQETPVYTQLHLGLGSFHRAHQAVYLQKLHNLGDTRWQLAGGNIRPDMQATIDALIASGGAYTLETVTPDEQYSYQTITAIRSIVKWDEKLAGLTAIAKQPDTRIISFTVTEAGYYLDDHDRLDDSYKDLGSDLAGETQCTIYGALSVLLTARMQANAGPLTLMNCDNLRSNGKRFYLGFIQFLERKGDTGLLQWVQQNTSAPNGMVDRITPRPPAELQQRVLQASGRDDPAAIMSEAFIQWVLEDDFIAGRPAWEKVGVTMVSDVMPYEEAKIRVLNATHSCIAWAGTLRGYDFIHEGTHDPQIRRLAFNYVSNDVIPCLDTPESPSPLNLADYRDVVLERFANPAIKDTNQRVAMDGYSKIPGFILPTLQQALAGGRTIDAVSMLPALFLAFLQRQQAGELPYAYEDQAMDTESARTICQADDVVAAFVAERLLFGQLAGDPRLLEAMRRAYARVEKFIQGDRSV
ncbi:MAG: mannitol dehydrogenase family protein [Gammaproteobacteria bacterium]|nr:mannitol dehydrogenase family protein [Gammaproteobacteria bacterium]